MTLCESARSILPRPGQKNNSTYATGQDSFKMDCFKVEKWSESKFDILVGNHGRRVLRAKEEGDLPACHQHSVQKPASLMYGGA